MRATVQNIRAFHKYKDEFPILFAEYQREKKRWHEQFEKYAEANNGWKPKIYNHSLHVSEEAREEYLQLVLKYLQVKKIPNNNRRVWITTHNGGKHVGFYEDGAWWYNTLENTKVPERGIVIRWEKYD